ncbi:uncharacterized protein LOC134271980, partial [Saccostrea cucullata]|uniref:uncharacterized protein LOC134271980 n=1 Tax=Saccostrea cuccullata TaxID=36930 RepID=UPI002ED5E0BD
MVTCTQRMTTEENSSDGLTSVSTAPLVVEHMPLTISQLTDNSQPEGVMASDSVLTIAVDTNNSVLQESFSGSDQDTKEEPPSKRTRYDTGNGELSQDQSIKSLLFTINKAICMRLDGIENSIEILNGRTKFLEKIRGIDWPCKGEFYHRPQYHANNSKCWIYSTSTNQG